MATSNKNLPPGWFAGEPHLLRDILSVHHEISCLEVDRAAISQLLARRIRQIVGGNGAVVYLLRGEEGFFAEGGHGSAAGLIGQRVDTAVVPDDASASRGACLRQWNPETAPEFLRRHCDEIGSKSLVWFPLQFCGHVFGLLAAFATAPEVFTRREDHILRLLARSLDATLFRLCELVSERERRAQAEDALKSSEKLALVGRESAALAHEIKSPLEALGNIFYLLENNASLNHRGRQYLEEAQGQLQQAREVSACTLGFSRETSLPSPVKVAEALNAVLRLYRHKIAYKGVNVRCRYDFAGEIENFPGEFRQIFANLIVNALEVVERGRGRLILHARKSRHWRSLEPGIRIVVADNGVGIRPEHRAALFQPFFTTKNGKGTGLGLWVSRQIVGEQGGNIRVRSRTGREPTGTVFSVFLPLKPPQAHKDRIHASLAA